MTNEGSLKLQRKFVFLYFEIQLAQVVYGLDKRR